MTVFYYLLFVCSTTLRINVMNTSLSKEYGEIVFCFVLDLA